MEQVKPINEVLGTIVSQVPKLTLQEILATYNHVDLTEDEITEAMIGAKRKKLESIDRERLHEIEKANRAQKEKMMQFDVIRTFMIGRAKEIFKGFVLDENNANVFNLFCFYFIDHPSFIDLATKMGVKNPSLQKGILLCGVFGTGKSWLMKLFARNARQVYHIRSSKKIAEEYVQSKEKKIPDEYLKLYELASNDFQTFNQPKGGLCIDDIGAEGIKNNFGNISNVIGDLIEERYNSGFTGPLLHGTTNLTSDQLEAYYGGRVKSRMRELFNFIELPGEDRRK